MKILTANFLTCAVKACKTSTDSYPLHFQDAELQQSDIEYNPEFIKNILPKLDWEALKTTAAELGFNSIPANKPDFSSAQPSAGPETASDTQTTDPAEPERLLQDLHILLLATEVKEGKMVCGHCGHEYKIKEGIANFLLPSHLV